MDRNILISPEIFDEAERYLLQQMNVAEQQVFEQKLATDAMLQEGVKQVQLMLTGIKEVSLAANLNHFHNELPVSNNKIGRINNANPIRRWLVAASIIFILALGSWLLFKKNSNEKLYADYFQPDPGLISAMSATDNYVFDRAMIDYKTGNYTEAITAWKSLQASDPANDTLNYFIGAAHLGMKNTTEAIPYLQSVTKSDKSFFLKDAYWYLGLAMLKEGKLQEAVPVIERSEHPQKQALLQQIKQISK